MYLSSNTWTLTSTERPVSINVSEMSIIIWVLLQILCALMQILYVQIFGCLDLQVCMKIRTCMNNFQLEQALWALPTKNWKTEINVLEN